jgi:hypothetical protein
MLDFQSNRIGNLWIRIVNKPSKRRDFSQDLHALNVVALLNRVIPPPDSQRPFSLAYRQEVADAFVEMGDTMTLVAVSRWRSRGSIPMLHLLTLLQIAKARGIEVDLLDFAMPATEVAEFKEYDRAIKLAQRAKMAALIDKSLS